MGYCGEVPHEEIMSAEGTTQGCPAAMDAYGIGILPLLNIIKPDVQPEKMKGNMWPLQMISGADLN